MLALGPHGVINGTRGAEALQYRSGATPVPLVLHSTQIASPERMRSTSTSLSVERRPDQLTAGPPGVQTRWGRSYGVVPSVAGPAIAGLLLLKMSA
jgi:hypothetical protein